MARKKGGQRRKTFAASSSNKKPGEENPFELHVNKTKHRVLGQKVKHSVGKPGVSRNKTKMRFDSMKKGLQLGKKSNVFVDKRIGEYDDSISKEDRSLARMVQARKRKCKKNIYNLNEEEEVLTHLGEPILNAENLNKPLSDSEDEDDAVLSADHVDKLHFGGFLTKKADDETPKTHREALDGVIGESKQRKKEMKEKKDKNQGLSETLNEHWKDKRPIVPLLKRKNEDAGPSNAYNTLYRRLGYEPRGAAAKSVNTEEQIKKKQEEKMMQLEKERRIRMINPDHLKRKKRTVNDLSVDRLDYYDGLESSDDEQPDADGNSHAESKGFGSNMDEDEESCNARASENAGTVQDPRTMDELAVLIDGCSVDEVPAMVLSIVQSLHPSLKAGNKMKLGDFFNITANYLCTYREESSLRFTRFIEILNRLVPHLYDIAQHVPLQAGSCFRYIIMRIVRSREDDEPSMKASPSYDVLITLKLISVLFSTSDYHHTVATPAMLLMSDILSKPYKVTLHNVLSRLFLSSLFFECVAFSKRLATEPLLLIQDILYMASLPQLGSLRYVPRHAVLVKKKNFLFVSTSETTCEPSPISLKVFDPSNVLENTNALKISIIFCAVKLSSKFAKLYDNELMFSELFSTIALLLKQLPLPMYPKKLVEAIEDLKSTIDGHSTCLKYLTFPKKKPPMLKMLEPKFEMNPSAKKRVTFNNKLKEQKQLQQKIKKEERGLVREVRRETRFMAAQCLKQGREADEERSIKVNKLSGALSTQEGDVKKLFKKK